MRIKIFLIFCLHSIYCNTKSQENSTPELYIQNFSNSISISVKIYPISCVFNGWANYDLKARYPENQNPNTYNFINGRNNATLSFSYGPNSGGSGLSLDPVGPNSSNLASLGFGKYKIEVTWGGGGFDTCTIEYDYGYILPYTGFVGDCMVGFRDNNNDSRIVFKWSGSSNERNTRDVGKKIESWNQYENGNRTKNLGDFRYDATNNNNFILFPQDSRSDCYSNENQIFEDNRSRVLTLNLTIDKNINTRETLVDPATNILISQGTFLKISSGKTFNMITPTTPSNGTNNLIIDSLASLLLLSNAKIVVNSQNTITLRKNSKITFYLGSEIVINQGGRLCNEGAAIRGNANIIFKGGLIHYSQCKTLSDYWIKDSVKFILDTNAVLEIPDSTTLHFTGKETALILKANSKLKFGVNSKILIDSGAKLVANNAEFSSIDSTKSWLGIVVKGSSKDTIKNCTIQNAVNGITIVNKTNDSAHLYSTEVSGCNFVNKTNSALNSGIYVYNSKNILIMNNNITTDSSPSGFVFGIYAEYCPAGNFNIIGNTIINSDKGMAIIQSSPYIARNTLNGNSTCESGLLLHNSNGTIEYNIVHDFFYSYFSYYSSPNLLKNTFDDSSEDTFSVKKSLTTIL